jgi:signal transduction histidine kinase
VCRVIGRQTQQMARIMDDLLDTTRIIRGQVEVHRERIDLRDIVPGSLDALREAAAEASLRLDVSLPDEPLWVDADLARLQQAATNLLGNAIKFTPDGGRIRFALTREHGNGVIMVADSGCGMTPEVIEVIFDPFTRGPAPLRKSSASMGMGLALVRSIATALGGEICAQSNGPDQGSTFEVRIPLVA